jgi:hypothetical protein
VDVAQLERQTHLAREDDHLARDVHARQVIARIGLGIAERSCLLDERREWATSVEAVEQKRQRTRQNSFDLGDLIAGLYEIADCLDDRQGRSDRRLI